MRLDQEFFLRTDVVQISRDLLGKYLVSEMDGVRTVGKIVETEAYRGPDDKACHAHLNRFTKRTAVMFEPGGVAYIYLCYGIHHLFNIVTAPAGMPHAVLVRALEPVENLDVMQQRRNLNTASSRLTAGPGMLSQAMGLTKTHSGHSLVGNSSAIWIEDRGTVVSPETIIASPRVGIDYAEECALWDWRFRIRNNPWTSKAS